MFVCNVCRVGDFLGFVRLTTRAVRGVLFISSCHDINCAHSTPHVGRQHVWRAKRNRLGRHSWFILTAIYLSFGCLPCNRYDGWLSMPAQLVRVVGASVQFHPDGGQFDSARSPARTEGPRGGAS